MTDSTPCQRDSGRSPTVRSVPAPRNRTASSRSSFSSRGAAPMRAHVLAPRGDRVVRVEAHAELDELPEPLEIGLAEHLLGPAGVRDADDRPVVQLLVDLPAVLLGELASCAPCRRGRRAGRPSRSGSASPVSATTAARSRRRSLCARSSSHGGVHESTSSAACSISARRTCWSRVEDVDVAGAGPVRGARDGTGDLGVLDAARAPRRAGPAARWRRPERRARRSARCGRRASRAATCPRAGSARLRRPR